jgi:hypothetical protein
MLPRCFGIGMLNNGSLGVNEIKKLKGYLVWGIHITLWMPMNVTVVKTNNNFML